MTPTHIAEYQVSADKCGYILTMCHKRVKTEDINNQEPSCEEYIREQEQYEENEP